MTTRTLTLSALFAVLTCIGSWIKIPMIPVPFTLQTFFVLLSGLVAGSRVGGLSQIIYLSIGLAGFPVFSQGGGMMYIFHPTFGYLLGFPVAAILVGRLIEKRLQRQKEISYLFLFRILFMGVFVIAVLGVLILYLNLNFIAKKEVSFNSVLMTGFLVFLPADLAKIALLTWLGKLLLRYHFHQDSVAQK